MALLGKREGRGETDVDDQGEGKINHVPPLPLAQAGRDNGVVGWCAIARNQRRSTTSCP